MSKIYMMVTEDELQLPLAVADTIAELGRITGNSANSICSALCHRRKYKGAFQGKIKDKGSWPKYLEVIVEDNDE